MTLLGLPGSLRSWASRRNDTQRLQISAIPAALNGVFVPRDSVGKDSPCLRFHAACATTDPGDIDYNARNDRQGQLPPDLAIEKRFARFDTPQNGIRALAKLLINYRGKDGMPGIGLKGSDTGREAINRWAPLARMTQRGT